MFELETRYVDKFVESERLSNFSKKVKEISKNLHNDCDDENDYRGWINLPVNISDDELDDIQKTATKIISDSEILVVIGIGDSYLVAAAAMVPVWQGSVPVAARPALPFRTSGLQPLSRKRGFPPPCRP